MTEPIKLPPLPDPDSRTASPLGVVMREIYYREKVEAYARLAVEQATADLRAELLEAKVIAEQRRIDAEKAEAERDEARAELARLTTLRPASEWDGSAAIWHVQDPLGQWLRVTEGHALATHWTPLPPVKEAD